MGNLIRNAALLQLLLILLVSGQAGDTIRILGDHHYPPIEYLENGEIHGMFQDFVSLLENHIDVPISYELLDWKEAQQRVRSGEAQALTVFSDKGDRGKYYEFTAPFFVVHFNLFVRADDIFITELEDLHGSVVGVTGGGYAKEVLKDIRGIVLRDIKSNKEALELLLSGEVRAVAASKWVAAYTISENNLRGIKMIEPPFNTHAVSMGVQKGDTVTLNHLNRAIAKLKKSGEIDEVLKKWSTKKVMYITHEDVQRYYSLAVLALVVIVIIWLLVSVVVLKKQVALKTEELSSALEKAQEGVKAKSQFLATMSHEIRTPMSGVLGMLDLLRDAKLSDEELEYLETAYVSGENLLTIINDILDFSKIEAGKMTLEQIPFNLNELAEDVARVVAQTVKQKAVEIILDIDFSIPSFIEGDPTRLRQVILNLMSNAVKFTREGHVLMQVVRTDSSGVASIKVSVTDTGIGIQEEVKSRVFKSFEQADSSITRKFSGTGLGLAISKELVQLMGGDLCFVSDYGKGSTFWFSFPLTLPKSNNVGVVAIDTDSLAGKKVLVVDDYDVSRSTLERLLLNYSMFVEVATGGESALEKVERLGQNSQYDLIVTDMSMPGMSGYELAEQLHRKGYTIPVVLLTSLSMNVNSETAQTSGISSVLTKPVRRDLLLKSLVEIVLPDAIEEKKPEEPATVLRSEHILVAEDNVFNQNMFKKMLQRFGFSVTVAGNGAEAVLEVGKKEYDLILMDLQMPVMDGITASRAIRDMDIPFCRTVPIIALTANVLPEDKEECLQAGMNDFIVKPVKMQTLKKGIEQWLTGEDSVDEETDLGTPVL